MDDDTLLRNHWALDNNIENTIKAPDDNNNELVYKTLISKLGKWQELNNENLNIPKCLRNSLSNQIDEPFHLKLPYFNKINSTNKNTYFKKTQNWIGYVEAINEQGFTAKLVDKSNSGTYEIAQFNFDEISKSDMELISKGAIFYWSVGFENKNGQIEKVSLIRFKRSIDFTENDIDNISDKASEYAKNLNWQ
jgi:hypothetical protein